MKARLVKFWEAARSSYWFIPSLMTMGAIGLAFVMTYLDASLGATWVDQIDWLYANKPEGARALLSTIAGSMITVAGVTFSITIAAVAYATNNFGPRLLTNFMQDQGNQVTLGTFIATFLYCLLVLRTIRSPEEAAAGKRVPVDELAGAFVPHLAILCGLALALCSIGVLIFFIHHVPESIHASNVTADIGRKLNQKIKERFPGMIGFSVPEDEDYDPKEDMPDDFFDRATPVDAEGDGYVQYIDEARILRVATREDLLVRIEYRPGDFVSLGKTLAWVYPAEHADDGMANHVRNAFVMGRGRTQRQDILFLAQELVEIASRALSPGINDPFTAMTCLDWLGNALSNLGRRSMPGAYRYDDHRELRVIVHPITFEEFADAALGPPRPYVEADRNAALHMMKVIADVACDLEDDDHRQVLLRHARALKHGAEQALSDEDDLDMLSARFRATSKLLRDNADERTLADEKQWLGGSG